MRVIPVLDLKRGLAVHAIGGDRTHYAPARSVLHDGADPVGLARAYRDSLGLRDLYLADLDAIAGGPPALPLSREIAELGLSLWIDAGLRDGSGVADLIGSGASMVVAGSETLRGPEGLAEALALASADRLVFSLDLRDGSPILASGAVWGTVDPGEIARIALGMGVRRILLLDLARVGSGMGVGTAGLVETRSDLELYAGGGVAGLEDLQVLRRAGFAGVLVGSALQDGRIGAEEIQGIGREA